MAICNVRNRIEVPIFLLLFALVFADSFYTLIYDETTNKQNKKELQIKIRYWSEGAELVRVKHLESFFIGHARGQDIKLKLMQAVQNANLPMKKLLMLGSDGPNVNKTVFTLINEEVRKIRRYGLINIGTCNIHVLHNAFLKGLDVFGDDVSDLAIAIKQFFKDKSSRWEDYKVIQKKKNLPKHVFIKHVTSRWLTLCDAASRLIEQWPAIEEYFLNYIPRKCDAITKTNTYITIRKILKNPTIKCQILFVISSANLLNKFLYTFQREEPLIHLLYTEILSILKNIMLRFCKKSALELLDTNNNDNIFSQENLKDLKDITVGDEVEQIFNTNKNLTQKDVLCFRKLAQKHYLAICTHMLKKIPINTVSLIKNFRCLQPSNICHTSSISDIVCIAKALPFEIDTDKVSDEFQLLQLDKDLSVIPSNRIDSYWQQIFALKRDTGDPKYPNLNKMVKAVLSLSHGSADVEQGFSDSANIITLDRTNMSLRTLNSILHIKDAVKNHNNRAELVPIDQKMISQTQFAHRNYKLYMEAQQKKELEEKEKENALKLKRQMEIEAEEDIKTERRTIEDIQKELKGREEKAEEERKVYLSLLNEANKKLKSAIKQNNMIQANVAQCMLESAKQKLDLNDAEKKEIEDGKKKIEKRRNVLMKKLINKMPKLE